MNESEPVAVAVAVAVGEPLASALLDGQGRLDPVEVPGVAGTVVWSALDRHGDHPLRVYVGRWPDGQVRALTADQDAWAELTGAVGVHLDSAGQARAYVEAFLEVTRAAGVIVRTVTGLDELPWRPGSVDEEAAKATLLADPPPLDPVIEADTAGFRVELTLVVDQRLQRNTFGVTPGGAITSSYRTLADGLPFPIAR